MNNMPIGIFDSDIGGISVVSELQKLVPYEDIIYFADTKNYPYGTKSEKSVLSYSRQAIEFLTGLGVKAVLCACSTASAVAVPVLKGQLAIDFRGLFNEELVTDTVLLKNHGTIGIIATDLTVRSKAFEKLFAREGFHCDMKSIPAKELVNAVTKGVFDQEKLMPVMEKVFKRFENEKLGCLIIGCTHFYHIKEQLKKFTEGLLLIEPAKVAVNCLFDSLIENDLMNDRKSGKGRVTCYVSKDVESFKERVKALELLSKQKFCDEYIDV